MFQEAVRVTADDCTFESHQYLGVIVKDPTGDTAGVPVSTLSLRGCTMTNNCWGASFGCDLSDDDERVIRAVNTFDNNFDKDITRHYEDKKRIVQPWRRGWAVAAMHTHQ
jgi:hypothetical protein